ncbi:VOC family protein [Haladaptatus sp.]|uniref:VOC family protein n=1 Tax=Haladaptatus sp. TaxID=1973141 RepID=UPI003C40CEA1
MQLNHTNLTVSDVETTAAFFEEYFDLQKRGGSPAITILSDDAGTVLTLMRGKKGEDIEYPSSFHIGIFVDDEDLVDEKHRRLEEDGYDVTDVKMRHNTYDFYVEAPGGFSIEFGAR